MGDLSSSSGDNTVAARNKNRLFRELEKMAASTSSSSSSSSSNSSSIVQGFALLTPCDAQVQESILKGDGVNKQWLRDCL